MKAKDIMTSPVVAVAPPAAKPSAEELMAPAPGMSLYLLLSQDCNLGCIYCLNGKRTYRKSEQPMMPEAVAFAAVERCAARIKPGGFLEIAMFGGEPLLVPVMKDGRRMPRHDSGLAESRERARRQIDRLPPALRALDAGERTYPVQVSPSITGELDALRHARQAR